MNGPRQGSEGVGDADALGFPNTSITHLVLSETDRQARARLIETYYGALGRFLRQRLRVADDVADEVLQEFFLSLLAQGEGGAGGARLGSVITHYDPVMGRFRHYLMRRLRWFLTDWQRRQGRLIRRFRPLEFEPPGREGADGPSPDVRAADLSEGALPRAWARTVLGRALRRLRNEYGRTPASREHWLIFRERVVRPLLRRADPPGFAELLESLGLFEKLTARRASYKVTNARRRCAGILREVVREYMMEEEVDRELLDLFASLAKGLQPADRPVVLKILLDRPLPPPGDDPAAATGPTARALLHDPSPRPDQLAMLKDYTKILQQQVAAGDLPAAYEEPVHVIYFACRVVARTRAGAVPSSLDDPTLVKAAAWVLDRKQDWIDPQTRSLFRTYQDRCARTGP